MKHSLIKAVFVLSLLAVLCGCGKDGTKESDVSDNTKTTTVGGSVTVGVTQDLDSLDPHIALAAGTDEILFNIFEGLVKPNADGSFSPAVASAYTISDDAKVYTFTLRENVKFHNGKTVTAEDVVYSLKRCAGLTDIIDPEVAVESALSVIESIETRDEHTIVLNLKNPSTELISYLTCAIVPCDYKEQKTAPVGTGPFKFVSYSPLESFVVERFEDYYGSKAFLEKVTFKIFANTDTAFMELLAGKVDVFPYLTDEQAAQLGSSMNIVAGSTNMVQALFLNNAVAPFDDIRVRQALSYAVDRKAVVDMVSGGRALVIGSGMYPGLTEYYDSSLETYYSVDTAKAKELLKEAGYENGLTITVKVPSNYQYHMDTAQILVEQLKAVNVTLKIEPVEWATWLSDVYVGRNFQSTIIALDGNLAPNDILKRYVQTAKNNFINFKDEAFDTAYNAALVSTSNAEKAKLYKEAQAVLTKDAASVYIQTPAVLTAVNKNLAGYTVYPVYVQDMARVYFTK